MRDRRDNPFQNMDLLIPMEFREEFASYCQTGETARRSDIDRIPFPRMVDFWFLALCVAGHFNMDPMDLRGKDTHGFMAGTVLSSDPWRIDVLMLLAIGKTGDVEVIADSRKIMEIANGLAAAGIPEVLRMLHEGDSPHIWNLSDALEQLLDVDRRDNISARPVET